MNAIEIGRNPETGQIIMYESSEADWALLNSIASILVPILISVGLKALIEFISTGEFAFKYPGGRIKVAYDLSKEETDNPKKSVHRASLILDNEVD